MKQITIEKFRLEGVKLISSSDWDGELYQMSRSTYLRHKNDKLFSRPGTYVIYADHFDKQSLGHHIYIGQGDAVGARLDSHVAGKKFWNHVLFFTSEWMNIAFSFNIEHEFLETTTIASRYLIDNDISGQPKQLGKDDRKRLDDYIASAKVVVALANIDIFTANTDGTFSVKDALYNANLKIVDCGRRSVKILADSRMYLHTDNIEVASLLASGTILEESKARFLFKEDVEVQIDMSKILPTVLGVHAKRFTNTCGVSISEVIEAVRSNLVQRPEH